MLRHLATIFIIGSLLPLIAYAQLTVGHVTGTVTDTSGAVIQGAAVTLTNSGTGISQHTVSTSTGNYAFEQVDPGTYSLHVEANGFSAAVTNGIVVHVQETVTQNYHLDIGNVTTQVTVTETAPLLQAQDASVGQEVDERLVNNLPLVGRDWTTLAHIAPGTTSVNGQAGTTSEAFSSNGVNSVQNDMRLNGIDDNMEFYGGFGTITSEGATSIIPAPDALQEFKLEEGNYSAQFGHSTGSVLDAVIKSGTDTYRGDLWEYLRNTNLNANDWFLNNSNQPRSPYHENQFGGSIGGPVRLPFRKHGLKNTFWFFDAERSNTSAPRPYTETVPTAGMVNSGFQNMSDLIQFNSGSNTDSLGRVFSTGTIMDPATTRNVYCGVPDSVTGLPGPSCGGAAVGTAVGTVRDPFYTGSVIGVTNYTTVPTAMLDQIPSGRIDPNAVKLLSLYPAPTKSGAFLNDWVGARNYNLTINQYDLRIDSNLNDKNIIWGVWDVYDALENQPGILSGFAQGANYGAGTDWSPHWALAGSYTHIFSPTMTNVFRVGGQNAQDSNVPPFGNQTGIPAQFGIQGITGGPGLGGLPNITMTNLVSLGVSGYNPVTHSTPNWEIDEVVTKIHGNHTFNIGYQLTDILAHLRQPTAGSGQLKYTGQFSDITTKTTGYTAMADMLLSPSGSYAPGLGYYEGGPQQVVLSTANFINSQRWYNAAFFQDDWKITPKLTLNLGLRWDKYGATKEMNDHQTNLVGSGAGNGPGGILYVPKSTCSSLPNNFVQLLTKDSISLKCTSDRGLMQMQSLNFAPRLGFAYQIDPSFVVRGGYGITYGSLGNIGAAPYVLGNNYPFVFSVQSLAGSSTVPITYTDGGVPSLENAFQEINISSPANATIEGLQVAGMGINDKYQTPYVESYNLTVEKQLSRRDAVQIAYVGDVGKHLDSRGTYNQPSTFIAPTANQYSYSPFPDLGLKGAWLVTTGVSSYNSMQAVYNRQVSTGLNITANYTYSHCMSDQADISEGLPYRAQFLAGFGTKGDYTTCVDDARHVFHASGSYDLPFGHGREFFSSANHAANEVIGGWNLDYIFSYQSGQPFTVPSAVATSGGFTADADITGDQYANAKSVKHWLNASAFTTPPVYDGSANYDQGFAPLGPKQMQSRGPGFFNIDSSVSKDFAIKGESTYLQFRAEAYNLMNHPQFSNPGSLNYTSPNTFASITSVRNPSRIVQLALKLYY
ncbi:TonB-dependent receptor [Paracidobacterium acidisoli]|nr:carboxypeptidase-like regulatory domain-containing protein [Paracidobacterium acidisoli]MBT9332325.1 carboxypeptidase-like regulatory domain-containing protein [Paracidobacterium acidisoli]